MKVIAVWKDNSELCMKDFLNIPEAEFYLNKSLIGRESISDIKVYQGEEKAVKVIEVVKKYKIKH